MTCRVVLVGGGVRSGKSAFALRLARTLGDRRTFIATAQALDTEMEARIARHRAERGDEFHTVEETTDLAAALSSLPQPDVVVVDCLTLWISNLLMRDETQEQVLQRVDDMLEVLSSRRFHALMVTNEVGMGVVPESALGRVFRDIVGLTHQRIAAHADEVYVALMGNMLRIKPAPVAALPAGGIA